MVNHNGLSILSIDVALTARRTLTDNVDRDSGHGWQKPLGWQSVWQRFQQHSAGTLDSRVSRTTRFLVSARLPARALNFAYILLNSAHYPHSWQTLHLKQCTGQLERLTTPDSQREALFNKSGNGREGGISGFSFLLPVATFTDDGQTCNEMSNRLISVILNLIFAIRSNSFCQKRNEFCH